MEGLFAGLEFLASHLGVSGTLLSLSAGAVLAGIGGTFFWLDRKFWIDVIKRNNQNIDYLIDKDRTQNGRLERIEQSLQHLRDDVRFIKDRVFTGGAEK